MSETSRPSQFAATRRTKVVAALGLAAVAMLTVAVGLMATTARKQRSATRERDFWVLCQPGFTADDRAAAFRSLVVAGNREWRAANVGGLAVTMQLKKSHRLGTD